MGFFKLVKQIQGKGPTYGGQTMGTGDVREFTDEWEAKARRNPDFVEVTKWTSDEPEQKMTAAKLAELVMLMDEAELDDVTDDRKTVQTAVEKRRKELAA